MNYFRYRSTNVFFVKSSTTDRLLAIDAGWPCTLYEYARGLKSLGYRLDQVSWALVTHFHMDHAGLVGEFLERGVACLLFENQGEGIDDMERIIGKTCKEYTPIRKEALRRIESAASRDYLGELGILGEVIVTPGHSPDSVSYISDEGEAVIGDLPPPGQIMPDDATCLASWEAIRRNKVRTIYPSHADVFELEDSLGD